MRRRGKWLAIAGALSTLTIVAAACSSNDSGGGGQSSSSPSVAALGGSVVISGSSTVQPISSLVAENFAQANPDVQISVDGPGTGDGFALFCDGKTDINDASRPIESTEADTCQKNGINYVELKVGLDGITVMTNPANDAVTCLSKADLYALFGPESQGLATWADANSLDKELGGKGAFPDAPLDITAPGEESGTYDAFIELAGISSTATERGLSEDQAAALRPDYQASPNDNVIIQAMEGSPTALGFVGFAYADQAGGGVTKVQIDGGSGCVDPSKDTIADGSYPLSRSLYIYANTDKAAANPALKAFVDYYMTQDGFDAVSQADYVGLPADQISATQQAWSAAGV